jgi:hypothetical protein
MMRYFDLTACGVNKVIPGRTNKEYRADNKVKLAGIHNCECGGIWSLQHKPRHNRSNMHIRYLDRLLIRVKY